jgi:hypothetical protein
MIVSPSRLDEEASRITPIIPRLKTELKRKNRRMAGG